MTGSHYVVDIMILLAVAVVTIPVFRLLGLGSVLGYLVAGAIVGALGTRLH